MENQTVIGEKPHRFEGSFAMRGSRWVIGSAALVVLVTGLWIAEESGEAVDRQIRSNLAAQAADVAATLGVRAVKDLSFTPDDDKKAIFRRKCDQLQAYSEFAGAGRFYVVGLRNGQIVSGPESSIGGRPPASPPGTVYENPDQQYFDVFARGQPQVWVSCDDRGAKCPTALAPVLDPATGAVLAAVGVDAKADKWSAAVLQARMGPIWITLALLIVLLLSELILEYLRGHSAWRTGRRSHAEIVLCGGFTILLTLALYLYSDRMERLTLSRTFNLEAHNVSVDLENKIYDTRGTIREMVYHFESSEYLDRAKFRSLCDVMGLKNLFESILWMPAVPEKEVQAFIEKVRASGVPDFSIWQSDEQGLKEPISPRPVHYPVLYIEPPIRNGTIGFDVNSEPKRSAAIQDALSSGMATASEPVNFVEGSNSLSGFVVFYPVQARVQKGLLAARISPESIMASFAGKNRGMDIRLFYLKPGQDPVFIAGTGGSQPLEDRAPSLSMTFPVFRFGQSYAFLVTVTPDWVAEHPLKNGRIAAGVGLLLTLLITCLTGLITNRRVVLERLVERRTDELKLAHANMAYLNQRNELILNSAAEGILGLDSKGILRFINPAALKMLGYEAQELIGRPSHSMWHHSRPDGTPYPVEECKIFTTYQDGIVQHSSGEVFWRKNGTCFPVEYDSTPIYEDGRVAGAVMTFADITERKKAEDQLNRSMSLLEATLDATADGILVVDGKGRILRYNRKFIEMWRIPEAIAASGDDDATMKCVLEQLCDSEKFLARVQELYRNPEEKSFDILHFHDGRVFERFSQPQRIGSGVVGRVWSFHDVTERAQSEALLWASQTKLDLALQAADMGVWQWDVVTNKRTYDRQTCALLGVNPITFGQTEADLLAVVHPDDRKKVQDALTRTFEQHAVYDIEHRVIWPDGTIRHIAARAQLFLDDGDQQLKVSGVCWDISSRRKAEDRIRLLVEHLQMVREEERKRIARELHDDIGQILTAIKIDLVGVQADCRCEGDVKNKIDDIQRLLLDGIQSVHTLCRQLRPGALDDLALSDALEGLMEDWKMRNQVECTMFADVDDEALSDEVKTAVFRMVQEALTNVSRYAQASKVEINLVADEQAINVTITDNGRGMEPGAADKPTSFGLLGMRERIENLGGELGIESAPGKGTCIEGTIPLLPKRDNESMAS